MKRRHVASAAFAIVLAGCSFLVDTTDRVQCSVTADCQANVALSNRVCRAGFCELDPKPVSNEGGEGCTTSAVCTQVNGGKSICKQAGGACVQLAIDGCTAITPGWDDPNPIFVGTLLPLTLIQPTKKAPDNAYAIRAKRAIELAAKELRDSLPGGYLAGGKSRPVSVIQCDSRGDPATAKQMFTHLTDVVGAQAVIVGWDEDLASIAADAQQKKTTLVCSDCLAPVPAGTVTYRILPNITSDAALVRWRVGQIEAELEAKKPGDIKIALLTEDLLVSRTFQQDFIGKLTFNGQSAASQIPVALLDERAPDPRKDFPDYDGISQRIAAFEPDVIVVAVASDFPTKYLPLIEQKWTGTKERPSYVVTELSYSATMFDAALLDDNLRARISGTRPFATQELKANQAAFELAYRLEFNESGADVPSTYESFYVTALAIASASGQPSLDTAAIANGFGKLGSGTTFDIGKNGFANALGMLAQGSSLNVRGIFTELEWNAQREIPADMGMFCFDRKPGAALTVHDVESVRLSATTGQVTVTGTYACP